MPDNPNPQGKGLVPVLQSLEQHRVIELVPPKQIDQVEMELFTSLFVLQSDIRFNPVAGRSYWLYQVEGRYSLLLVAPHEWHRPYRGRFIGECVLQSDRTWTLQLSPAVAADSGFMQQIEQARAGFVESLEKAACVDDMLPRYEAELGFYARVLAYTLGRSLEASMGLSGIRGLSYAQAKGYLDDSKV